MTFTNTLKGKSNSKVLTPEQQERFDAARKTETRINGILTRIQTYVVFAIFGAFMFGFGSLIGSSMSWNIVL